jgi:hypothetical protein
MTVRVGWFLVALSLCAAIDPSPFLEVRASSPPGTVGARSDSRRVLQSVEVSESLQIYRDTGPYFLDLNTHNIITIAGTLSFLEYYADDPEGNYVALAWDMFNAWVNKEKAGVTLQSDPGKPYLFRTIYVDDYSSVAIVNSTYEHMVQQYDYFLSPTSDDTTIAAINVVEQSNKLLISAHTSGTSVFQGKDKSFSMLPSDHWYHEIGFATFASLAPGSIAVVRDAEFYACNDAELSKAYGIKYNYSDVHHYVINGTNVTAVTELMLLLKKNNVSIFYGCSHTALCETV